MTETIAQRLEAVADALRNTDPANTKQMEKIAKEAMSCHDAIISESTKAIMAR